MENYDIEELYEFADATGILERHKALLSQPFNESQVFLHFQHYCVDKHGVKHQSFWNLILTIINIYKTLLRPQIRFSFSQVDMKIMYYELIRMLIDYERKNHPETYDATKTVGKIEGYQELTNKLQR